MLLFCKGKKDFCNKEVCDKTCEFHDGSGARYVKVQTFADKLRSMTDQELVDFIYPFVYGVDPAEFFCKNSKECGELMDADKEIPAEWCKKCLLERLQKPIEGTKHIVGFHLDKEESGLLAED